MRGLPFLATYYVGNVSNLLRTVRAYCLSNKITFLEQFEYFKSRKEVTNHELNEFMVNVSQCKVLLVGSVLNYMLITSKVSSGVVGFEPMAFCYYSTGSPA